MRLWSLHPSYLDKKRLVALWREGLLAKKVLSGETNGYRFHPQLSRFRAVKNPLIAINRYLEIVYQESQKRGYTFDKSKILLGQRMRKIPVTRGQIEYEWKHLTNKIPVLILDKKIIPHPLFKIVPGDIEGWEKIADNPHAFPYALDYRQLDLRKNPNLYRIGKGEQGVLLVEPYKSEILPHWQFKTKILAKQSAIKIYKLFLGYKKSQDFIGMDMARKFLQMGYTRSRRYANHPSGKKYKINPQKCSSTLAEKKVRKNQLPRALDSLNNEKAEAARLFYSYLKKVKEDSVYKTQKKIWLVNEGK